MESSILKTFGVIQNIQKDFIEVVDFIENRM